MRLRAKWIAAAAFLTVAAAALYGFALKMGVWGETESSVPCAEEKETLSFWYADEALTNFITSAAVAFGEREGVNVIPRLVRDNEYLEAINRASLHSVQAPDAYILSHDHLEKAYLAGLAAEIWDGAGICDEEHFPRAALSAVSYRGKLVGYPLFFETSALIYNETYLAEWAAQAAGEGFPGAAAAVPSTVGDILNIADTFDAPQGVESIMRWDIADILYNYWIVGGCMTVGGECGDDPGAIDINNPEALECLKAYQELGQVFFIDPEEADYDSVITDFCQGRLVFVIAATDAVKRLADAREDGRIDFDYGVAAMPQVREGLQSRCLSVTTAVVINGYSKHKELANRFAAYLADERADSLYERTGRAAASLAADAGNGLLQIFKEEYARSAPLPKMMATGNFWLQMEGVFSRVWNGADGEALVRDLEEEMAVQAALANGAG